MWDNIIVTLSNLYGLRAFMVITSLIDKMFVGGAIVASMCHHTIEHHKHGMTGCQYIPMLTTLRTHHVAINIDRLFAVGSIIRFFPWDRLTDINLVAFSVTALACLALSEGYFTSPQKKVWYIFTHSAWHVLYLILRED